MRAGVDDDFLLQQLVHDSLHLERGRRVQRNHRWSGRPHVRFRFTFVVLEGENATFSGKRATFTFGFIALKL